MKSKIFKNKQQHVDNVLNKQEQYSRLNWFPLQGVDESNDEITDNLVISV